MQVPRVRVVAQEEMQGVAWETESTLTHGRVLPRDE